MKQGGWKRGYVAVYIDSSWSMYDQHTHTHTKKAHRPLKHCVGVKTQAAYVVYIDDMIDI